MASSLLYLPSRLVPQLNTYHGLLTSFASPQDLSVRLEGEFLLRYRVFDMFSKLQGTDDIPTFAECYGGRFRVYESRDFPGLQPSTDLTKVRLFS